MDVKGVWNEQFDAARSAFETNFDEGLEPRSDRLRCARRPVLARIRSKWRG